MKNTQRTSVLSAVALHSMARLRIILVLLMVVAIAMTGCPDGNGGSSHTHSYSTAWSSDATQHWRECTANDGAKTDAANHTGSPCTVCGYTPTLTGITAVYNGPATIDHTTPINDLKTDLTVTAQYSDNTSKPVTDYTLSGTLSLTGTSTITVTGEGTTTTFTVTAYALFTAVADMTTFLTSQADNTATTAYNIRLNVAFLPWNYSTKAETAFSGKFVNLDLSGSTFTLIGNNAFYPCPSLAGITIPEGVTTIGQSAFSGCTGLTSITIPNSVTSINDYAFQGCTNLASVTIGNSVTSIGSNAFNGCTSLASVTIAEGVTVIGVAMFAYCTSLTSVTIPASVTSIGISAFRNTSLASITIPASVTSIDISAFTDCTNLASVTFAGMIDSSGFTNVNNISFPGNLRAKYLDASGGIGTYTATAPVSNSSVWTKQ